MPPLNPGLGLFALGNDFLLDIHRGGYPDKELVRVEGRNPSVTAALHTIWEQGEEYNFSSAATDHSISSSNAGDTQNVEIEILDTSFVKQIVSATLTGQTPVSVGNALRVLGIKNAGSADFAGDIYVFETGTVTAGVPDAAADKVLWSRMSLRNCRALALLSFQGLIISIGCFLISANGLIGLLERKKLT